MLMLPGITHAQVSTFQACSQGALQNCASVRLTSQPGAGVGGSNLFQIAINNLGAPSPTLATSIYFMSLLTGKPAAPGLENDLLVAPTSVGGASITDASNWSLFESGDAIFLSALGNNGVGNCAASAAVGGFGQMANTCAASSFVSFSFSTQRAFNPAQFSLSGMEFVAIATGNVADSCNDILPCTPARATVVPEPSTIALMIAGMSLIAVARTRRRSSAATRHLPPTSEV